MEHSFCIIVLLSAVIVALLSGMQLIAERRYQRCLARLRRDPTNAALYERTLAAGHIYERLVCHATFNEEALTTALQTAQAAHISEDA